MYKLKIRKQPIKSIRRLSVPDALRVRNELSKLANNPDRQDIDVVKLKGRSGNRLRVGNWRIIFERDEQNREIDVLRVGSRGDIYKQ